MMDKKSCEQANVEKGLRREMRKDFRNVQFMVKYFDTYSRWRDLSILSNKTKDPLR